MDLRIRDAKKNNSLTDLDKERISRKSTSFPLRLKTNQWHQVYTTIRGDEISCTIDGKLIGTFKSEGFAHPTKRLLRLLVAKNAFVDDVQIWRKN